MLLELLSEEPVDVVLLSPGFAGGWPFESEGPLVSPSGFAGGVEESEELLPDGGVGGWPFESEEVPDGGAVGAEPWVSDEEDEDVSAAVAVRTAPVVVPAASIAAIASAVSLFLFFIMGLLLYVRCMPGIRHAGPAG